jgi:hypothetical protein
MPLWGANTSDESKPKNLTAEEKSRVFADTRGWVITRPDGNEEVLVAIRNLSGAAATDVKLGGATISQVYFRAASYSTGATGTVRVVWNEKIVPTTTGTLSVTATAADGTSVSTITATRSGNATARNYVDFTFTAPSTTGSVLTITSQTITMGINDAGQVGITSDLTIALVDVASAALVKDGSTSVTTTV